MNKKSWIAIAAVVAALGGTAAYAGADHGSGHGHGRGHSPWTMDAAQADKHIETMVVHILPDATEAQKSRLTEIAKGCFNDVKPIHQQLQEGHEAMHKQLAQPAIDFGLRGVAPFPGQPVELRLAVVLGESPVGIDEPLLFHPVERRIERALLHLQHVV